MRQIDVDIDVFALIWAKRREPEASENEILRRILQELDAGGNARTHDANDSQASTHSESLELKNSKDSMEKGAIMPAATQTGKIRWVDDVQEALRQLGGVATLHRIYGEVERIRREGGRTTPKSLDATVRQTIESFSSDSENYRGEDLFRRVSRGEWALREWATKNMR